MCRLADTFTCDVSVKKSSNLSIIYLNAGFTILPCLSFFSVIFLHVYAIWYIAMVKIFSIFQFDFSGYCT